VNVQGQIYVPISHSQFLWYLGYKIRENLEKGKKADVEHWSRRNGDLVDMYNLGTGEYSLVLWSSVRIRMFKLDRCRLSEIFKNGCILSRAVRQITGMCFSY